MDDRHAMPPWYAHRGFQSPPPGMQMPPVFRPMVQTLVVHSGPGVESPASGAGNVGGGESAEAVKRKRGRPRKYGPDGSVSLSLSPVSTGEGEGEGSGQKRGRGRGRPPGSGRKQQLAGLGEWVVGSAGVGFTPHVITVPIGEDVAAKILSFSHQGPRAVCILSANGAVSTVTLRQPSASGGTVTYEGCFQILGLSGSYLLTDDSESRSRTGGLSIIISGPDGRVIGGGVGGLLIAASPVQLIVGSFTYGGSKSKNKAKTAQESGPDSEPPEDKRITPSSTLPKPSPPTSTLPIRSFSPTATGEWPVSRQMDIRNLNMDFDLTQG